MTLANDQEIFQKLQALGAGEFAHVDGSLIDHLRGTHDLLRSWGANDVLCRAGLYHAAYGTAGYSKTLVSLEQREQIKALIGADAEGLVFVYCACDRRFFWPQVGVKSPSIFRDRFTGEEFSVDDSWLKNFCELTVANELEIARRDSEFIIKNMGPVFRGIFTRMQPYLSKMAYESFVETFGTEIAQRGRDTWRYS